jgi:hypothetical protein
MRILYLLLYAIIFWLLCSVLAVTAVAQLLLWLFSNQPSARLAEFGRGLGAYMAQVVRYLSFASDTAPFPFSDWPKVPTQLNPEDFRDL